MKMAEANSYEEQRRRQVEANKRKLDELRLPNLSAAVRQAAAKPTPARSTFLRDKTKLRQNQLGDAPIRRSGRIARHSEQPDYRVANTYRAELPNPVYVSKEQRAYAFTKAEELKDQLGPEHPTFIKPISHCYATKHYILIIPVNFRQYLPVRDEMMVVVDEMNNELDMFYGTNANGKRFLTGWRGFAVDHNLADGDCVVFQLIERTKFKVYAYYQLGCAAENLGRCFPILEGDGSQPKETR